MLTFLYKYVPGMSSKDKILTEIKKLASRLFANIPAKVYLYGSRARGDAKECSDWDILIVTDDSIEISDAFGRFAFPFAEIGWHLGEQITPLLYTRSEWEAEKNTTFYQNVQSDALPLYS